MLGEVQRAADDGGRASALVGGLGVLLAGRPNAGKSSLLNLLSDSDAAIVHEEACTHRRGLEGRAHHDERGSVRPLSL